MTAAYTLTVNSTTTNKSVDISVPIESSAGYVAGLVNSNASTLGVEATAITRLKFPPPKSVMELFPLLLKSKPGVNNSASISASVLSTNLTNLANTINNFSGRTGVTANLSSDKKHLILENKDGDDIEISSFTRPDSLN